MSELNKHTESVEYGLAETIWNTATDDQAKKRAIQYYEMACSKNDGAAFLALYKTKHEYGSYLNKSIDLGYLPALLYAGTESSLLPYQRLIYLAAGMSYAHRTKLPELINFQHAFASVSENFAIEFIPEILESNKHWEPGKAINHCQSELEGQLVQHPEKYEPAFDKKRDNWKIFVDCESTANFLKNLPGAKEYFQAYEGEDSEDGEFSNHYRVLMEAAKSKGNGQAMYALTEARTNENLLYAAQHGSIDALLDLVNKLNDFFESYKYGGKYEYTFYNTTRIETDEEEIFLSAINCFLYIFSIMERLGIAKYCDSFVQVARLSTETESGYEFWDTASASELKYELCSHKLCCQMNNRTHAWKLGDKFDAIFYENFEMLRIALN